MSCGSDVSVCGRVLAAEGVCVLMRACMGIWVVRTGAGCTSSTS